MAGEGIDTVDKYTRAEKIRSIAEALAKVEKPGIKEVSPLKEEKQAVTQMPRKRPNAFVLSLLGLTFIPIPWTIKAIKWYW